MTTPIICGLAAAAGAHFFELGTSRERAAGFGITIGLVHHQLEGIIDSRIAELFISAVAAALICNLSNPNRKLTTEQVCKLVGVTAAVVIPFMYAQSTFLIPKRGLFG